MGIDKYTYQSKWADKSLILKVGLWFVGMTVAFCQITLIQCIWIVLMPLLTLYLVPIRWKTYGQWLVIPLGILITSTVIMLLSISHHPEAMHWSLPIGSYSIGIYQSQIDATFFIFMRSLTSILATFLFAFTTPMKQLLSMMVRCHVPMIVIELTMLMYRFIFIFVDEMVLIYQAQSMKNGYQDLKTSLHSAGVLASMLFQKTLSDALALNEVLEIKLYTGEFPID